MIKQFSDLEFKLAKPATLLPLTCKYCSITFYRTKHQIQRFINPTQHQTGEFCSPTCQSKIQITQVKVNCTNCNNEFTKIKSQYNKFNNHFCSRSCNAIFANKNKKFGSRRSKLEVWLEEQLTILYTNLEINYNKKSIINSELDIYIPSLNLAFELNGIFHYEPIYGINKLSQIQNNDISKSKACHDAKIDLCIIDVSLQSHFTVKSSQKYLDIITKIINSRVEGSRTLNLK